MSTALSTLPVSKEQLHLLPLGVIQHDPLAGVLLLVLQQSGLLLQIVQGDTFLRHF